LHQLALQGQGSWVMDSGASSHMTSTDGILLSRLPPSYTSITVGNGHNLPITCRGSSVLPTSSSTFTLSDVLVVPSLVRNLLSVRQFTRDNNCSIEFDALGFSVKDMASRRVMLRCDSDGDLYTIPAATHTSPHASIAITTSLWHSRLGHPSSTAINTLRNTFAISCNKVEPPLCHSCQLGKHVRLPFTPSQTRNSALFDLIHCDVWTSPVASISGCQYYLVLLDDYSHFCWTFPLIRKSEVASHITDFCAFVQTQFGVTIKSFQADNGTEFANHTLTSLFSSRGILFRFSCPYTSQQNGKVEQILRTLNNISRTLLIHAHMSPPYWAEALVTATYLLNRRPYSSVNKAVPYTILYNKTPEYSHLRVFGCICYPNLSATTPHKLAPRSTACVFLGYPSSHKGYHCLNLTTRHVIISRHVVFDETTFPFTTLLPVTDMDFLIAPNPAAAVPVAAPSPRDVERPRPSPVVPEEDPAILMRGPVLQELASRTPPSSAAPPPPQTTLPDAPRERQRVYARRSRTTPALPEYVAEPALHVVDNNASSSPAPPPPPRPPEPRRVTRTQSSAIQPVRYVGLSATATTPASPIPGNYRSGLADPNWRAAMAEEYQALIDNGTWRLVPRPPGANVVSGKWIFKHKYHSDGTLARHKARWVVRDFSQQHGIDYDETFSPVVKHPTIRTVLSIAASRSWPIRQLDVKNAFLHGHLEEIVYCQQPPDFVDHAAPDHVCLLQRSLYGLKQAPRAWYQRFATYIRQLGFTASSSDVSLYKEGESLAYLLLYVDDIILTASSTDLLQRFITLLHSEFAMTDLGDLHHFLNISVTRSSDGIFLS
jgi:transposase InsO family protein